jgi:hypothetical protein
MTRRPRKFAEDLRPPFGPISARTSLSDVSLSHGTTTAEIVRLRSADRSRCGTVDSRVASALTVVIDRHRFAVGAQVAPLECPLDSRR